MEEALKIYYRILEAHPQDVETLLAFAHICTKLNRHTEAISFYKRVLEIEPTNETVRELIETLNVCEKRLFLPDPETKNSIVRNRTYWSNYEWPESGDEWSQAWGGTEYLWYGTILPRIHSFLPSEHILEIAPGFGRCTQYLLKQCQKLTVVDLAEKCIGACKKRFSDYSHIHYYVNDGKSLDMIEDHSIDFVFSWDSLVHVEEDVIYSYLGYLTSKLKPGGIGFLHHSNIGAFRDPATGILSVENRHWRGESMSAELFREYCKKVGLRCLSQEMVNWGDDVLNDCFSLFMRDDGKQGAETVVIANKEFMKEAERANKIAKGSKIIDAARERSEDFKKFSTLNPNDQGKKIAGHGKEDKIVSIGKYPESNAGGALDRNDPGALDGERGDKERTLIRYEKAVSLEPSNPFFLKSLADFYYVELRRIDEAASLYEKVLSIRPQDTETLLILGNIHVERGRFSDARDCYLKVLEIEPSNELAGQMAKTLEKRGQKAGDDLGPEQARTNFENLKKETVLEEEGRGDEKTRGLAHHERWNHLP